MIRFHRVLIATAIVFCFGFAGWLLLVGGSALLATAFFAAGAALAYYLLRLNRFLGLDKRSDMSGP